MVKRHPIQIRHNVESENVPLGAPKLKLSGCSDNLPEH